MRVLTLLLHYMVLKSKNSPSTARTQYIKSKYSSIHVRNERARLFVLMLSACTLICWLCAPLLAGALFASSLPSSASLLVVRGTSRCREGRGGEEPSMIIASNTAAQPYSAQENRAATS